MDKPEVTEHPLLFTLFIFALIPVYIIAGPIIAIIHGIICWNIHVDPREYAVTEEEERNNDIRS